MKPVKRSGVFSPGPHYSQYHGIEQSPSVIHGSGSVNGAGFREHKVKLKGKGIFVPGLRGQGIFVPGKRGQ